MNHQCSRRRLVIGVGNDYRSDDGVGLVVARQLAKQELEDTRVMPLSGEGSELLEAWRDADTVILVDAVRSGGEPGSISRYTAKEICTGRGLPAVSSHGFGVAEAVRMGAALGQLPKQLIIFGIEGKSFVAGTELSLEVSAAADMVMEKILEELGCTSTP
ncbi:MAG: hydrogenase maturation protease [Dehalococcoidia bacterium]